MAKLFITNLSKQHHQFLYAIVETNGTRMQDIPIGAQVQIAGDMTREQVDSIIAHHRMYGLKSVAEARKIKGYTGLIYSVDATIDLADPGFVEEIVESSGDTLNERSDKRRENATAAIADKLGRIGSDSRAPMKRTEVEQLEDTDGTPRVFSGVESVAAGVEPRNQGTRRVAGK